MGRMLGKQLATVMKCTRQGVGQRWMVGKAPDRAAVHGLKLPTPDIVPMEKVETKIRSAIEEKERKRMKIEESVDSQLKNWQVLYVENICSK